MSKPLIIIGAGDHAKVLLDILLEQGEKVIGLADKSLSKGTLIYDVPVIGDDEAVLKYNAESVELVNGIGSIGSTALREKLYDFYKSKGYVFKTVIHKSAVVSTRAILCEGAQILAGVVITTEATIGEDTIINSNASIDHACVIGKHCHIAPGCVLSGCVTVGNGTHLGTGSSIIQGIKIGSNVLLGAGSVVVNDIDDNSKAYGVPARMKMTKQMTGGGKRINYISFRMWFNSNLYKGGRYA